MVQSPPPKTALVTIAKDEGPYIWEWVAHHKAIGFDEIIMFQNDSTDGTGEILNLLQDHGEIQYLYNHAPKGKHQVRAYKRASRQQSFLKADWVMALDLDEFLTIKHGAGTLNDFWKVYSDFDCVFVNWKLFGSSGASSLSNNLVTQRFQLSEHDHWIERFPQAYKSFYKREMFGRPGIHKPPTLDITDPSIKITNSSALPRDEFTIRNFQCTDSKQRQYAQINHYIIKDAQSFVLKNMKGSAHQAARNIGYKYWKMRNKNQTVDTAISRTTPRLHQEMLRLDNLTNGKLSELTQEARVQHSNAFARALQTDEGMALYRFCIDNPYIKKPISPLRLL
ncbi:glycosyltransferase family 2 protein [Pacificibacter marinus]|uniref:Glycosyl transferase family 2 n=1 Tax=Pacificibacter marinus TaxID=658057 RepID=A0A1Y5SWI0_9RHOB|nr:glycosyltransferase family 2 protein [Pacificibacter marinus]SEK66855.1 Glycosyl transferase family 2 [Pacificibacter marinus]SLN46644.1 hypothetical protein PAM7971_02278 [Pacificibacter marinus]